MLEFILCSLLTIFPDYLYRRYGQGKRIGHEITLFSVWYELRWGITLCAILTVSLITVIFYFHPATTTSTMFFRTVSILPEVTGRVTQVNVQNGDTIEPGQELFRLDASRQETALETASRRVEEVDAQIVLAAADLATAEAQINQAEATLEEAERELARTQALIDRGSSAVTQQEFDRQTARVEAQTAALEAAVSQRDGVQTRIDTVLPAQKASAEASRTQAEVDLSKTVISANSGGVLEQFALVPGDVVTVLRPAGILISDEIGKGRLQAGFGQISGQVIKPGMLGEVTCVSLPYVIIPVVVVDVQDVIAAGQLRPTDQLLDVQQRAAPGTITVIMEPLYPGGLDKVVRGSKCITNLYTSNHDKIAEGGLSGIQGFALHAVDAMGVVHAAILRIQALLLPVQTLVLTGH